MKVNVVSDERGRILSLSIPGDVSGLSGIAKAGVLLNPGQYTHTINVPKGLEKTPLIELHRMLRVEGVGDKARLVKLDQFTEPFLRER
jgi:hypothetical protein